MTKEEWRSLQPGQLVKISARPSHIFKVISTGWEDLEEKDYQDDDDYIIEVKDLFDCFKGQFVIRAHHAEIFNLKIPKKIIERAYRYNSPYDFLYGYLVGKKLIR